MAKENKPKSQEKDDNSVKRTRISATHKRVSPAPAVDPNLPQSSTSLETDADLTRAAEQFRFILNRAREMAKAHALPVTQKKTQTESTLQHQRQPKPQPQTQAQPQTQFKPQVQTQAQTQAQPQTQTTQKTSQSPVKTQSQSPSPSQQSPVADKVVVADERKQAAEKALASLRANQKSSGPTPKSAARNEKPVPPAKSAPAVSPAGSASTSDAVAQASLAATPTQNAVEMNSQSTDELVDGEELSEFERQMQEQLALVVDSQQSRSKRKAKESQVVSDNKPDDPPEAAQWTDTPRKVTELTVEDVRDHATLGPHTIVSRTDGSRLFKNFVQHPDTTMIEHSTGNRLWIRKGKAVSMETREGTWSTNNSGRTWMHREPPAMHVAGMDFRPWKRTGDKLSADEHGNVTIKHKDGSLVMYQTDGRKEMVTAEGTRQEFDERGLLKHEEFINGGSVSYTYKEVMAGDPPRPKFVVAQQQRNSGEQMLERDSDERPIRMWSASTYRVEVGYDKKGELNRIDAPFIFNVFRKSLPGGKTEWHTSDGEKRNLSRVRITDNGTISLEETLSSGHQIKVTICADGSYIILGQTLQMDQYIVEGQDGKPCQITNPSGEQYSFTYDSNGELKTAVPGKHARSYERTGDKWHHLGAPETASKYLELQIKVDYLGDLAITNQVTTDYYKVDKRNADGYQSTFTMDMKNGKWVSNERIVGGTYTKTIDTDSTENRSETTYNHKEGSQKREVRDGDEAGYISHTDHKNRTTIHMFGWEGKPQGQMISNDGKLWRIFDNKQKKLAEFEASIDVHREGMTIKCRDGRGEEMLVRTDAKGVPYYFRDSSGEWISRNGLRWEQDNGPNLPKTEFIGRPALPDGYPLIAHDERMENFDTVVLVENGVPVRFSSDEGHQYVFKDNRWLLEDKTRKRKSAPLPLPPPPKRTV